jgi:hypothetical protein
MILQRENVIALVTTLQLKEACHQISQQKFAVQRYTSSDRRFARLGVPTRPLAGVSTATCVEVTELSTNKQHTLAGP